MADEANDFQPSAPTCPFHSLKRFSNWILTVEILLRESLVDDRDGWIGVGRAEFSTAEQRNSHGVYPTRRDGYEVGKDVRWRRAIDGNITHRALPLISGHPISATFSTPGTLRK